MVSNTSCAGRRSCPGTTVTTAAGGAVPAAAKGMLVLELNEQRQPASSVVHQNVVVIHSNAVTGSGNVVNMHPRPVAVPVSSLPMSPSAAGGQGQERDGGANITTAISTNTSTGTHDSDTFILSNSAPLTSMKPTATITTTSITLPPSPPNTITMPTPTSPSAPGHLEDPLILHNPPPYDPEWLAQEPLLPPRVAMPAPQRQPLYAAECRALHAAMMAPGARDHHLGKGIRTTWSKVPARGDGFEIPVVRYELCAEGEEGTETSGKPNSGTGPPTIGAEQTAIIYIHGGGLQVGEADSEELSLRRILKDSGLSSLAIFSIGYRLMPQHPASTCVSDSLDAFLAIRNLYLTQRPSSPPKLILIGSSSGGQLAAHITQLASPCPALPISGLLLRCPVTSDAFSGPSYVPAEFAHLHTSATNLSFANVLLRPMIRAIPRDGLPRMPLEANAEERRNAGRVGRTWVQVCTNDMLYSDGIAYARMVEGAVRGDEGLEGKDGLGRVTVSLVRGWPHTFWLKTPELKGALEAERAMLRGLRWVVSGEEKEDA